MEDHGFFYRVILVDQILNTKTLSGFEYLNLQHQESLDSGLIQFNLGLTRLARFFKITVL